MIKEKKRRVLLGALSVTFRIIALAGGSALLLSYISVYSNPVKVPFLLFFGLYFIPILIINLIILFTGLLKRSKATWITVIALLPSLFYINLFLRWGDGDKYSGGEQLSIMTYNVGLFVQKSAKINGIVLKEACDFVNKIAPSVICFQEFLIKDTAAIDSLFPNYPYHFYHFYRSSTRGYFGNLTISKYPIYNSGKITFKGSTNHCIYTDIYTCGEFVRIYNTHLESHSISFTALVKRIRNSTNVSEEILGVHDKVANTFKKRASQVNIIAKNTAESPHLTIVCGDFNDTPMSYTYNTLKSNKKDSFSQAGSGFGATYSLLWPLLRIDYILAPREYNILSHKTIKAQYSDHYPVIAEIEMPIKESK